VNDAYIVTNSDLVNKLALLNEGYKKEYYLYGDLAYGGNFILIPFPRSQGLTTKEREANKDILSVRIVVKNVFGNVA